MHIGMDARDALVAGEQNAYESGELVWSMKCRKAKAEEGFTGWHASMQRVHVAQAILLALRGTPGGIITCRGEEESAVFEADGCIDDTVQTILAPLLSTCRDRALIWRFGKKLTSTFEFGIINQALGAALLDICLSLHELVCDLWDQLDTSDPLAVVTHGVGPYQPMFELLCKVVTRHTNVKGSEVLCMLEAARDSLAPSCPNGVLLMDSIYNHACAPFLHMVSTWVYQGEVIPIAEGELPLTGPKDDFMAWKLEERRLPSFATRHADCVEKMLQSGKLALVLKKTDEPYLPRRLPLVPVAGDFSLVIEDAWTQANTAVLKLLKGKYEVLDFFRFMHRYFLVGNATWLVNFIDRCSARKNCSLSRTTREVLWSELQQLLTSSVEEEYSKYNITAEGTHCQLFRHTKGKVAFLTDLPLVSALQLQVDVKWPLSMVMGRTTLMKYNFMFRLLFRIKALRHDLNRCRAGRRGPEDKPTCILLHAMTSLLGSLETYICYEVIEPAFKVFMATAESTTVVEGLIQSHEHFIEQCLSQSLAYDENQLKLLEKVFLSIKLFSEAARRSITLEMVTRFHTQYTDRLQELLHSMEEQSKTDKGYLLQHLIRRLDFNFYYERSRKEVI